jgi:hypothetical protein
MNMRSCNDVDSAIQYLVWALEFIERAGDLEAAHHARIALEALRRRMASDIATAEK